MRRILAMAGFTLLMLGGTMFAQQYKNPNLPVEERAADLCRRLTLEEKVALMQNASFPDWTFLSSNGGVRHYTVWD